MTSPNETRLDALAYLAEMSINHELALRLVQLPANSGDAASQWYLGYLLWENSRNSDGYAQAGYWFKKASDQGLAAGHASLGAMHCTGALPKDPLLGEKWRQKALMAAEPGQAICGDWLAYENRLCLRRDYSRAFKWYVELAERGNAEACWLLGNVFHRGIYVKRSFGKALKWYRRAADLGHPEARESLRFLYDKLYGVSPDYEWAVKWFHQYADENNVVAQFILSLQYGQSFGLPRDGALIYMLIILLARQTPDVFYRQIMFRVGEALANGLTKVEIDDARRMASEWLSKWQPEGGERTVPITASEEPGQLLPETSE